MCCRKVSLLRRDYLSSAVNVLRIKPQTSDLTKKEVFELNTYLNDKAIGQNCCAADLRSVLGPLTH